MNKRFTFCCFLLLAAGLAAGCAENSSNYLFPDPYVAGQGYNEIVFTDLPASCTIDILTVNGDVVRTIVESDGDGQAAWDLRNSSGKELTSGLYLYIIESTQEVKRGKLVISR
jgi:hypothetical protein